MKTTLYRASENDNGRYWTPSLECAKNYMCTFGNGGSLLITATIDDKDCRILHIDDWSDFPAEIQDKIEKLRQSGYTYVYQMWEEDLDVRSYLAARYDWIVYTDDYPENCETWYCTGGPLGGEVIDNRDAYIARNATHTCAMCGHKGYEEGTNKIIDSDGDVVNIKGHYLKMAEYVMEDGTEKVLCCECAKDLD